MKKSCICLLYIVLLSAVWSKDLPVFMQNLPKLDQVLSTRLPETEPGAAIIITLNRDVIFEKCYGSAELEKKERLNSNHMMGIASMSKQFTGMAVLFLVAEGKVKLEDDINRFLPELNLGGRVITIKQLLSHISGLPELTQNETFMSSISTAHSVKQIIEMGLTGPHRSEPGEKYIYCNTGYTIVVALIEKLSGQKFADFLKNRIFIPLNMNQTCECDLDTDALTAVPRYQITEAGFQKAETMHFSNLIGGGGIITCIKDMARWGIALVTGDHLPPNFKLLWQPNLLNTGESTGYGLGMGVNDFQGKCYYYHPGMGSGMNSVNMFFPDYAMTITVIRNLSKPKHTSHEIALLAAEYLMNEGT